MIWKLVWRVGVSVRDHVFKVVSYAISFTIPEVTMYDASLIKNNDYYQFAVEG